MKGSRALLLIILLLAASIAVPAAHASGIIGAKGGVGVAWFMGDGWFDLLDDTDNGNRGITHAAGGLFLDAELLRAGFFGLSLQPEILYSRLGGGTWGRDDTAYILNGIEFPLYIKPRFGGRGGYFFFLIGVDLLYLSGRIEADYRGNSSRVLDDLSLENRFNAGFALGLGFDFKIGPVALEVAITHGMFFLDLFDDTGYDRTYPFRNRFEIGVGYWF